MDLDDLKAAWTAHGVALERSLAINERLLRETLLRKVRFALAPLVVWRALEVALGAAAVRLVVGVLAAHLGEPRYLVAAGALAVLAVALTALGAASLVGGLKLDYTGTVTAIQRDLERLQLVEYHATKWALLGGVLLWLPAALVGFEAITGVDALARVDLAWLIGNLAFGVGVVAVGQAWSRRHVERSGRGPRAQRILDALSGRSLRSATSHLAELARFQADEPPGRP
jgi:hypothetical protein